MDRASFKEYLRPIVREILDEDDIDEATTTANVDGYNTPYAFSGKSTKSKKKKKKIATNSTHYSVVKEDLNNKDLKTIKKLIRVVMADVLRDIWIKRHSWR